MISYRRAILALLLPLALLVGGPELLARQAPSDPQGLARALQQKYEQVADFTADFVHQYQGGVLRKTVTERGHVIIKKPGKMRWTYEGADEKVFVSDGVKMYSYLPADRQVYVATVPADEASTPALFLAGKGSLVRDFDVSAAPLPPGAPAGSVALALTPRRGDPDYDSLVLVADPHSLEWRMLVAHDRQGGQSTFTFSNIKENVGVPDRTFIFKIPRGVDVITDSAPRR